MTVVLDDGGGGCGFGGTGLYDRGGWGRPGGEQPGGGGGGAGGARGRGGEGVRPRAMGHVPTLQPGAAPPTAPMSCNRPGGANQVSAPDPNETEAIRWMPLGEISGLIADGAITGAATIIGARTSC